MKTLTNKFLNIWIIVCVIYCVWAYWVLFTYTLGYGEETYTEKLREIDSKYSGYEWKVQVIALNMMTIEKLEQQLSSQDANITKLSKKVDQLRKMVEAQKPISGINMSNFEDDICCAGQQVPCNLYAPDNSRIKIDGFYCRNTCNCGCRG